MKHRSMPWRRAMGLAVTAIVCAVFLQNSAQAVDSAPHLTSVVRKSETTTARWESVPGVSGYQILYNRAKTTEGAQKVTVPGAARSKRTLRTLDKSKSYSVWIRSYTKKPSGTVYSAWSTPCRVIAWNTKWSYSKKSKIHSDSATLYDTDAAMPRNRTVCINAGHGTKGGESKQTLCHPDGSPKVTGGSTGAGATTATAIASGTDLKNGMSEAEATLKLAKIVKRKLLDNGYDVLMVRETSDAQMDNIARTVFANKNADCHIALHYDSTSNNKGAFAITVPDVASYKKMYPVSEHWREHNRLGKALIRSMKKNGTKIFGDGTMALDLTQTSYSKIPSVDLEVGDCASDVSEKTLESLADGIAAGVDRFFG